MGRIVAVAAVFCVMAGAAGADTEMRDGWSFLLTDAGAAYDSLDVLSGDSTWKFDVVIVPDGFKEEELEDFRLNARHMIREFLTVPPYASNQTAFNFWMVNLVSPDATTELVCGFDGRFPVCSEILSEKVCSSAGVPGTDAIVIVTRASTKGAYWPGEGSNQVYLSSASLRGYNLAHELAHVFAHLGDEYACFECDGSDDNETYTGGDLGYPNLSASTLIDKIPWADHILEGYTVLPTDPTNACNSEEIGAWEGGGYYAHGVYRPQEYCLMDGVLCHGNDAFCAICTGELEAAFVFADIAEIGPPVTVMDLAAFMALKWRIFQAVAVVIPPVCPLNCPVRNFSILRNVILRVASTPAITDPAARLSLHDDRGELLASAERPAPGVFELRFTLNQTRTYYVVLYTGPPHGDTLGLETEMIVDGTPETLP